MDFLLAFPTQNALLNVLVLVAAIALLLFFLRILLRVAFRFVSIGCFVIVVIGGLWLIFHFLK